MAVAPREDPTKKTGSRVVFGDVRAQGDQPFSRPLEAETVVWCPHIHAAVGVVCAEAVQGGRMGGDPGVHDNRVVGVYAGVATTPDVVGGHLLMPFTIATSRGRLSSLSSRRALTMSRIIRGDGLVPRNFRLIGGPHW
jgi:hypothetical protein